MGVGARRRGVGRKEGAQGGGRALGWGWGIGVERGTGGGGAPGEGRRRREHQGELCRWGGAEEGATWGRGRRVPGGEGLGRVGGGTRGGGGRKHRGEGRRGY